VRGAPGDAVSWRSEAEAATDRIVRHLTAGRRGAAES